MNTGLKSILMGAALAVASISSAAAFTSWSTFEYKGYEVTARYNDGQLRHIKAANAESGDVFAGRVTTSGIAIIESKDGVRRYDVDALVDRFEGRTTIQDLAQAQ